MDDTQHAHANDRGILGIEAEDDTIVCLLRLLCGASDANQSQSHRNKQEPRFLMY